MSLLNFSDPQVALTWLLSLIIFLPALGALFLCVMRGSDEAIRYFSLLVTIAVFALTIWLAIPAGKEGGFGAFQPRHAGDAERRPPRLDSRL